MAQTIFRVVDIEHGNNPSSDSIVGVFRFDADRKAPSQVVVAEIDSALYAYEQLLDVVNDSIEQSRSLLADQNEDPFARFEKLVARLNSSIASFIAEESTPISWKRVNIFLIECNGDQLCLAGRGRLTNLFLQKTQAGYNAFDLCSSLDQSEEINSDKLFSSVLCGDMKPGDRFFIGTNNFDRLSGELVLRKRLGELPPVTAALEIKNQLKTSGYPEDFAGVIISGHLQDSPVKIEQKQFDKSTNSMKSFNSTAATTGKTLAPIINPLSAGNETDASGKNIFGNIKNIIKRIDIKKLIPKKRHSPTPAEQTALRSLHAGSGTVFTPKVKIGIGAGLAIVVLLSIGYYSWHTGKVRAAEIAAWEQSYTQATGLRSQAENDLLYAKDKQAAAKIDEADKLATALAQNTDDRRNRVTQLQGELAVLKNKARKLVELSGIQELYALPITVTDGALTAPVLTETQAFIADNQNKQIIAINLTSREQKTVALPDNVGRIISGSIGEQSIVFLDDKGGYIALNPNDLKTTKLTNDSYATGTADFYLYINRSYALDSLTGQVFRQNKTASGFGRGSAYITDTNELAPGSVAIAIDSNVYLAYSNGSVRRYLQGKLESFSLGTADPSVRALSGLWTTTDDSRLIMTDPVDKRVLIYDKNGLLMAQLTSPEFSGTLRDLSSRLNQKQALVVSGNRLLLIPLP